MDWCHSIFGSKLVISLFESISTLLSLLIELAFNKLEIVILPSPQFSSLSRHH